MPGDRSRNFVRTKLRPADYGRIIAEQQLCAPELPLAIPGVGSELPLRQGLKRKAHRICMGKSEELKRKARFLARSAKKAPGFRIINGLLNRLL
jgi:hypothetical protein